jgi:predicted small metal-binding protein
MATPATSTGRKYIDCSEYPSDNNCSLRISGTEDEVMAAAAHHAATVHGEEDTPEFRDQLRGMLKDD